MRNSRKVLFLKQIHSIGMCFVVFILMPNCFAKEMMNWAFSLWLLTRYKKNRRCKWERVIASVYISSVLKNRLQSFQKKSIAWLGLTDSIFENDKKKRHKDLNTKWQDVLVVGNDTWFLALLDILLGRSRLMIRVVQTTSSIIQHMC